MGDCGYDIVPVMGDFLKVMIEGDVLDLNVVQPLSEQFVFISEVTSLLVSLR
jgi:hypothetical protein